VSNRDERYVDQNKFVRVLDQYGSVDANAAYFNLKVTGYFVPLCWGVGVFLLGAGVIQFVMLGPGAADGNDARSIVILTIVVGALITLLAIILAVRWLRKRRRNHPRRAANT
jgi:Kef-type K+ transport system membrane component KefB